MATKKHCQQINIHGNDKMQMIIIIIIYYEFYKSCGFAQQRGFLPSQTCFRGTITYLSLAAFMHVFLTGTQRGFTQSSTTTTMSTIDGVSVGRLCPTNEKGKCDLHSPLLFIRGIRTVHSALCLTQMISLLCLLRSPSMFKSQCSTS